MLAVISWQAVCYFYDQQGGRCTENTGFSTFPAFSSPCVHSSGIISSVPYTLRIPKADSPPIRSCFRLTFTTLVPDDVLLCPLRCPRNISQKSACLKLKLFHSSFPISFPFCLPCPSQWHSPFFLSSKSEGILPFFAPPSTSSLLQDLWTDSASESIPQLSPPPFSLATL